MIGDVFPFAPAGDTMPEIYYGKRSDDLSGNQEFQNMRNQFKNMIARDQRFKVLKCIRPN